MGEKAGGGEGAGTIEGRGGRQVAGGGGRGKGGLVHHIPRIWARLQVLIISRGRRRSGAEASCKAICWNRPPREDHLGALAMAPLR